MEKVIQNIKELRLEGFEKLQELGIILPNEEGIWVPLNVKEIIKRVGEKLRQEIMQNKNLSDEEKEWQLCQCPNDTLELMLLSILRDIIILKLKALNFTVKTEYYIEKPNTQTKEKEFQASVVKFTNDVFGEDRTENMAEVLFNAWNRNKELQKEQKLSLKELKEMFYKEF